jgi:thymidylate synthase ThyX
MKLVEQKVERIEESDLSKLAEMCAKNCYQSELLLDKEARIKFLMGLVEKGHTSVFEHCGVYLKYSYGTIRNNYSFFLKNKYTVVKKSGKDGYVYTNLRVIIENNLDLFKNILEGNMYKKNIFIPSDNDPYKIFTFKITTDHGQERSLLRHRSNSFTVESTRWINYLKKFGISFIEWQGKKKNAWIYKLSCKLSSFFYKLLIKRGEIPEVARSVLNLGHKTDIIMSGFRSSWRNFFLLRLDKKAHFQIRNIAEEIKKLIA